MPECQIQRDQDWIGMEGRSEHEKPCRPYQELWTLFCRYWNTKIIHFTFFFLSYNMELEECKCHAIFVPRRFCQVVQSCPTRCDLGPWDSPGKNTGGGYFTVWATREAQLGDYCHNSNYILRFISLRIEGWGCSKTCLGLGLGDWFDIPGREESKITHVSDLHDWVGGGGVGSTGKQVLEGTLIPLGHVSVEMSEKYTSGIKRHRGS